MYGIRPMVIEVNVPNFDSDEPLVITGAFKLRRQRDR